MTPLENNSSSKMDKLGGKAASNENIKEKMSVHTLDRSRNEKVEWEPAKQPHNDVIEIFDFDEEHSHDDNGDFDAKLDRELQKMIDKQ